ncbi:hypothetical protein ACFL56_02990 [Candidatus Margulisiibacteriota bacterium]
MVHYDDQAQFREELLSNMSEKEDVTEKNTATDKQMVQLERTQEQEDVIKNVEKIIVDAKFTDEGRKLLRLKYLEYLEDRRTVSNEQKVIYDELLDLIKIHFTKAELQEWLEYGFERQLLRD